MNFDKQQQINGISIHYAMAGSGDPTLLMIHGLGSDPGLLRGPLAHLSQSWRVLLPTLRGHLPSGTTPPFTADQMADDLVALTRALSIERLVPIGFSRGAQVAFTMAARYPELVDGVISLGGVPRSDPAEVERAPALYAAIQSEGGLDRFAENFSGLLMSKASMATNPALRSYGKMNMLRHTPEMMVELIKASYAADVRPLLPMVKCPVLALVGADDRICDLRSQVELKSGLQDCVVRVLPRVGHDYAGEAPMEINAIMSEFLIDVTSRKRRSGGTT